MSPTYPSCTVAPGASQKIPGSVERATATGAEEQIPAFDG